ncbi:MAG: sulfatase [Candidatus Latescibacterota bacterium]|jgi:arylsulfatase A-like enzyme
MFVRRVVAGALTGAVLALLLWAVEWSHHLRIDFAWTLTSNFFQQFLGLTAYGYVLYLIAGSVLGALLGAVLSLLVRSPDGRASRAVNAAIPLLLGLPVIWQVGLLVNREYLPRRYAPVSLISDLLMGLGFLALVYALFRMVESATAGGAKKRRVWSGLLATLWVLGIVLAAAATLVWNISKPRAEAAQEGGVHRPNVVMVLLETTRAGHVSCYGYERETTPNMDALGREGVVFENYYSEAPFSALSKASLATGLYPHNHGVRTMPQRIRDDVTTLAEVFSGDGYRTAAFATGVLTGTPFNYHRGYRTFESLGIPYDLFRFATSLRGLDLTLNRVTPWYMTSAERSRVVDAVNVVPRALEWMDAGKGRPFFCLVELPDPHFPYQPPKRFAEKFTKPDADYTLIDDIESRRVRWYDVVYDFYEAGYNTTDLEHTIGLYDGEIAYADWAIGRLVEGLKSRGLYDDTIVVLTADHGENFGEHGTFLTHTQLYEQSLHVPMLMRYPEKLPVRRVEALVQEVDVFPTLLELAGVEYEGHLDGVSMVRKVENDVSSYPLFAEDDILKDVRLMEYDSYRVYLPGVRGKWRMVREGNWKLIYIPTPDGEEYELYDVVADPMERNNLFSPDNEVAGRLMGLLDQWMAQDVRGDEDLNPDMI